jgi:hypothetical protein
LLPPQAFVILSEAQRSRRTRFSLTAVIPSAAQSKDLLSFNTVIPSEAQRTKDLLLSHCRHPERSAA